MTITSWGEEPGSTLFRARAAPATTTATDRTKDTVLSADPPERSKWAAPVGEHHLHRRAEVPGDQQRRAPGALDVDAPLAVVADDALPQPVEGAGEREHATTTTPAAATSGRQRQPPRLTSTPGRSSPGYTLARAPNPSRPPTPDHPPAWARSRAQIVATAGTRSRRR